MPWGKRPSSKDLMDEGINTPLVETRRGQVTAFPLHRKMLVDAPKGAPVDSRNRMTNPKKREEVPLPAPRNEAKLVDVAQDKVLDRGSNPLASIFLTAPLSSTKLVVMKECPQCLEEFNPSSRHKLCPSCRAKNSKIPCPDCGSLMAKQSAKCNSCAVRSGDQNGNWKGGRTYHKKGYVMERVSSHHSGNPYVFQHILVMEAILGRPLYPEENVHHINGVKDDNREANLELWCKPQPSGIRASDALAWAQEIVRRYQ